MICELPLAVLVVSASSCAFFALLLNTRRKVSVSQCQTRQTQKGSKRSLTEWYDGAAGKAQGER